MDYRVLTSEDAEEYLRIRLESLKLNPEAFASNYEDKVAEEDALNKTAIRLKPTNFSFTMGAFDGDALVSVVTFMRESPSKMMHKGSIFAVFTTPSYRGKGIAKALFKELLKKLDEVEGLEQIMLTVVSSNQSAVKLYESLGFESFGTEKNAMKVDGSYYDEDYMMMFLK
ncbi:GNAT family N-acetyltransferase [Falsibacillus pallidus]|uniref:RimJ/RimL family protein N-acetyltransferase n=1 Tax=Falsibacillus pallidus TaxID=493781 RepID=A0A370GBE6_9BACI|nr:GNAT family protein [Falsibacillus pallidus]RDI41027.1 RimJ/RimL family protein N-acetyltransferase [Falsibacillus pallidus]